MLALQAAQEGREPAADRVVATRVGVEHGVQEEEESLVRVLLLAELEVRRSPLWKST